MRGRCIIGQQTGINIDAWPNNITTAATTWDTTGSGPVSGAPLAYRVYVVLDADKTITDETYEPEDPTKDYQCTNVDGDDCEPLQGVDPGQNIYSGFHLSTTV